MKKLSKIVFMFSIFTVMGWSVLFAKSSLDNKLLKVLDGTSYPLNPPIKCILELVKAGANPNQILKKRFYYPTTPLEIAVKYSEKTGDLEPVKFLLEKGANPNFWDVKQEPILCYVKRNIPLVKILIEYGADPYRFGYSGINSLHWAVEFSDYSPELVKIYLKQPNANVEVRTKKGKTPLMLLNEGRFGAKQRSEWLKKRSLLLEYGANSDTPKKFVPKKTSGRSSYKSRSLPKKNVSLKEGIMGISGLFMMLAYLIK